MRSSCHITSVLLALSLGGCVLRAGAQVWTQTTAPVTNWVCIASSADSVKLVAASSGQIFLSTNSGLAWTTSVAPSSQLSSVACSADGMRLLAMDPGHLYLSSDAGATWTQANVSDSWTAIASSADGSKLFATSRPNVPVELFYFSSDFGASWIPTSPAPFFPFLALASSSDGTRLAGAGYTWRGPDDAYISGNSGTNWNAANLAPGNAWESIAMSVDGTKLLAGGQSTIAVSVDSGATWVQTSGIGGSSVASSANGARLVAVGNNSIYTSTNSGASWTSNSAPNVAWISVCSSADGCKRFAAVSGGGIYICQTTPAPELGISATGGRLLLSWTVPSMNFVLQQSPTLSPGDWTTVGLTPTLNYTNLKYQVSVPGPDGKVFYRLAAQ